MGVKKPDQRFFETILANADTKASEAIMIGDRLDNDIIPARRIGMKTIWLRWGRYRIMEPRTPDEVPDATVADVREVSDAVNSLAN
ncbi:MAG: HAD family hydrolase [Gemmatimonadetes bacterium]|nr:HAD family hydrolase [Gemmatimonadota bacterium]